ncbi:MAG: M20/M25/M40 family metallo-hydrolase [Rhodothermales bacterium]
MKTYHAVQLLKDLVRFPSLSGREGPIADFVQAFVRRAGLPVARLDNNVYFWLGEGSDCLLLNSHLDVVPPVDDHPYDPFDPVEVNGLLFGRGTIDAKASGAAITTAVLELAAAGWAPPNGRVLVALTQCEETGGPDNGLQNLRPHLPDLSAALVGEPTGLRPCVAQKGLLILHVHAQGHTAHAARAYLGENAILKAARDLQTLAAFTFDREDPYLGKPTVTVTMIEGGTARNVVPNRCSFFLDIRTTPAYTHEEIIEALSGLLESDVTVHSKRIIPLATPVTERIVQACRTTLPDASPFGSPTASDWLFLHDVPAVKIGPGDSERSHTSDEHIEIAEVERAVEVYKGIIQAYFELAERQDTGNPVTSGLSTWPTSYPDIHARLH